MKIACIGNITFDYTVSSNKFIKEDYKSSFNDPTMTIGGPAFNAATVIHKFGADVDFYGKISNDIFGNYIIDKLKKENINIEHLYKNTNSDTITPFSYIIVNTDRKTRTICSSRSSKDFLTPTIDNIEYKEKYYNYILTDGKYINETKELIKKNPNAISIIDAGRVNKDVIELCNIVNYIICSQEFAEELTGIKIENNENAIKVYKALKQKFSNATGITITIGSRGYICENGNDAIIHPTYKPEKPIIDTNGAGDIFHGAFTYALSKNHTYDESLEFASITATLSTTKTGGRNSCPELEEVKKILNKNTKKLILKKDDN